MPLYAIGIVTKNISYRICVNAGEFSKRTPILSDTVVDSPQRWRSAPVPGRSNARSPGAGSKS